MPPIPKWLDSADVVLAGVQTIAQTLGTPGAVLVLKLVNNPGATGADPLTNGRIVGLFRNAGETIWNSSGTEFADRGYLEVKITGRLLVDWMGVCPSLPAGVNAELDQNASDRTSRGCDNFALHLN